MTILQLIASVIFGYNGSVARANKDLDDIGSVFQKTISNYRAHANKTRTTASRYGDEVKVLREKAAEARSNEQAMLRVADKADEFASKIENTLGFGA